MQVHQLAAAKRKRPARTKRAGPVETITVDRRVWKEALRIAKGDPRRIRIISRTKVEIL